MSVFIFLSTLLLIFSSSNKNKFPIVQDYKSISSVRIDFGGNISYRIYTANKPVIVKRLRSYDGDILVLYIKLDIPPEIKKGEN